MVIGVTMVKVIPDHEKEIYSALMERDDITEVYSLFGEYDLFVILEAQHQTELETYSKGDSRPKLHPGYLATSGLEGQESISG
jgi:hypothetical protein